MSPETGILLLSFGILVLLSGLSHSDVLEPVTDGTLTYWTLFLLPSIYLGAFFLDRTPKVWNVILDWFPIVGVLAVYESLKHMHANEISVWLGIQPKDPVMLKADAYLFGALLPTIVEPRCSQTVIAILWFFYSLGYGILPVVLIGWANLIRKDPLLFQRLRRALMLTLLGGYVWYILVPVAGPQCYLGENIGTNLNLHTGEALMNAARYQWDCFPSLHTALPWVLTLVAWRPLGNGARLLCCTSAALITVATVALRRHYGVDVIAGVMWALSIYALVRNSSWRPLSGDVRVPRLAFR